MRWQVVFDTQEKKMRLRQRLIRGGNTYRLEARSMALLRLPHHDSRATRDRETDVVEYAPEPEPFAP